MEKKEMMFYKMCEAMTEERSYECELLLFDDISCHNEIEIVFRQYSNYILVFKEMEIVKQINRRQVDIKNSEIEEWDIYE